MQAHGGTLFLDEIGDLPMDIQIKLLRFLENGEIRPVGSDRLTRADARLVCATHRPLLQLVEEGKFRRDLYYRLASVTIDIPALRERPEDIELLALRFAADLKRALSPRAIRRLQAHAWPGNVRELRHAIERASGLADPFSPVLEEDAFAFLMTPENLLRSPALEQGLPVLSLAEMERAMILKALRMAGGHRTRAAEILGVARSTLFEMIKRHRIPGPRSQGHQAP
jgi:DNA-binding NtrC family response regulator